MSDKRDDLIGLAESLVKYSVKQGADEVEVSINQGTEFSVDVRKGEIEKLVEAGSKGLAIRIIKDKKAANVSSSDFNPDTLNHLINNAIQRAELSSADPYAGLPDKEQEIKPVDDKSLNIFDPEMAALKPEEKIALAQATEKICLRDKRIANSYGSSFGNYSGETFLVNSFGFSGSSSSRRRRS